MAAIARDQAFQIAASHVAQKPKLGHPDYRLSFEVSGRVGDEWLFAYHIECLRDIPPDEQERFAGAGGFLISSKGLVRDLTVPMFIEAERKVEP
jgi:hypothetical protein